MSQNNRIFAIERVKLIHFGKKEALCPILVCSKPEKLKAIIDKKGRNGLHAYSENYFLTLQNRKILIK